MGLLNKFFKEKNKEQYVNRKYYKNYAEKVYVSEERDLKQMGEYGFYVSKYACPER